MTMVLDEHNYEGFVDTYLDVDEDYMFEDTDYYPYLVETESDGAFEDGCVDLLEKIHNLRKYHDLNHVDRAILEIIEELIDLL